TQARHELAHLGFGDQSGRTPVRRGRRATRATRQGLVRSGHGSPGAAQSGRRKVKRWPEGYVALQHYTTFASEARQGAPLPRSARRIRQNTGSGPGPRGAQAMRRQSDRDSESTTSSRWQRRAARQEAERGRIPKHGKRYVELAQQMIAKRA